MDDPEHEQDGHGIIEDLAICAIQLRDCDQGEAKRHVLDEVVMSARIEEKTVRFVIRGGLGAFDITVANVLFGLDSTIDDAVG